LRGKWNRFLGPGFLGPGLDGEQVLGLIKQATDGTRSAAGAVVEVGSKGVDWADHLAQRRGGGPRGTPLEPGWIETPGETEPVSPSELQSQTSDGSSNDIKRIFQSDDLHVATVANAVEAEFPGRVIGVNTNHTMFNGLIREVDINLGNLFIQVKGGNARGLTGQIIRTQTSTGIPTIGYASGISDAACGNAASQGITILRSLAELVSYIRECG
jgi:hypothetical protein